MDNVPATAIPDPEPELAQGFAKRLSWLACCAGATQESIHWLTRAAWHVCRANLHGHVCIPLESVLAAHPDVGAEVEKTRAATVETLAAHLLSSGVVCDGRLPREALLPLVLDEQRRLYLARYYDYERQLAYALMQKRARRQLTIISGGPGTGKTTTVATMLAERLEQTPTGAAPLRIALAAPTGKAAQRMQEALLARASQLPAAIAAQLPTRAMTLHRLLGMGADGRFRHHRAAPVPYDVIVVDEASMIDLALAAKLLDAIADTACLILLGDKDQLAAVEAGAVFAELSAKSKSGATESAPLADCVIWLEHNYRFGAASPIGALARAVCAGQSDAALALLRSGESRTVLHAQATSDLDADALSSLMAGYAQYLSALTDYLQQDTPAHSTLSLQTLFDAFNQFRVLCAVRAGAHGIDRLNRELGRRIRQALAVRDTAPYEQEESMWYPGRAVIVTRNDYALGLFNGDIGIALPTRHAADSDPADFSASSGPLRIWFPTTDQGFRSVPLVALPPHATAFAMTVHQSQGSEFEHVALVLPATSHRILSRELVYTAVTRARASVEIYAAPELLAQAISQRTARDSTLAVRLREYAQQVDSRRP